MSSARVKVDLAAVRANYATLCRAATGMVAAVVKADGYGLGAGVIAQTLAGQGCERFFVATAAEGAALRVALPSHEIYVLEGALAQSIDILLDANLIPVLNSPTQVSRWGAHASGAACGHRHATVGAKRARSCSAR